MLHQLPYTNGDLELRSVAFGGGWVSLEELRRCDDMKVFILGLVLGLLVIPVFVFFYLTVGNPPVATADPPFPFERQIVHVPLHARIRRDAPKSVPIEATADNLIAGAHIYRRQCATCHGLQGIPSEFAKGMYPPPPPLWETNHHGVIGVSNDPPGVTYWKVANGIRLTGMPAYQHVLNPTQMWQVSLLLANADKPLPPEALTTVKIPLELDLPGQQ